MSDEHKEEIKRELLTEIAGVIKIVTARTHRFAVTFVFAAIGLTLCAGMFIAISKDFILDYKKISSHVDHCEEKVKSLEQRIKYLEEHVNQVASLP